MTMNNMSMTARRGILVIAFAAFADSVDGRKLTFGRTYIVPKAKTPRDALIETIDMQTNTVKPYLVNSMPGVAMDTSNVF